MGKKKSRSFVVVRTGSVRSLSWKKGNQDTQKVLRRTISYTRRDEKRKIVRIGCNLLGNIRGKEKPPPKKQKKRNRQGESDWERKEKKEET